MPDNLEAKLIKVCTEVTHDPKLQPEKDSVSGAITKTFCNIALNRIMADMGYNEFEGKMANDIYKLVANSIKWRRCNEEMAADNAVSRLSIAAELGDPHGHVVKIMPGRMVWSAKWNKFAPVCANVGKDCGICGVNFAFAKEPDYFMLFSPIA